MSILITDQKALCEWLAAQDGHVDIAIAFWGLGAVDALKLRARKGNYRVLLDLAAGCSNPSEVKKLRTIDKSAVKCMPRLHAKALIGQHEMLIGSANASANGLGLEGTEATRWCELGVTVADAKTVARAKVWFEELWVAKSTTSISDQMLDSAQAKWLERQRHRPTNDYPAGTDILSAATLDPEAFLGRKIFVVVSREEMSEKGNRIVAQREKETGREAYGYEDWAQMPVDSTFLCFTEYPGESIKWDSPAICYTGKDKQSGPVRFVYPSKIEGFSKGSIEQWRERLRMAKSSAPKKWKEGLCTDLGEFVRDYPGNV